MEEILTAHNVSYDLYRDCPDPIADQDETNVYGKKTKFTFFFGIPTRGGDYNDGPVSCYQSDIEKCSEALIALVNGLHSVFPFEEIQKQEEKMSADFVDDLIGESFLSLD